MGPNIKTRNKKLEESECQKCDRKKDQARKKASDNVKPPQQTFSVNDGSKEGRNFECDRRRAEHNADNNVKPKTPKEIAEIEKRRRKRIEEESAKWNIGAEDAEEGESIEEDDMDSGNEEGSDYVDKDDEEDDDDVMDLD